MTSPATKTQQQRPKARARPRQPGPGPVGARRPGGRRKALAVMRKLPSVPRSIDPIHAITGFWDASLHKVAPPLRTTFGNFATVNLVERFQVYTNPTVDRLVWIPWSATPLAAITFPIVDSTVNTTVTQNLFKVLAPSTTPGNAVPKAVRPLRSSFRVTSLTKNINTASAMTVLSYDNLLALNATFGVSNTTDVIIPGSTVSGLRDLILESPESKVYPLAKFVEPHTFVSVPCSWPDYNRYHSFTPFRSNANDMTNLSSGDLYSYSAREDTITSATYGDAPSYPYTVATTTNLLAGFGDVPPMRGHLIFLPAASDTQILEFEVFRQLGCRFQANSIGHTFHHTPTGGSEKSESNMLSSIQSVSSNASAAFKTAALDVGAGYSAITGVVKAISSDAASAMNVLSSAMRYLKVA